MQRSTTVRLSIFLATVVASWAVLSIGSAADIPNLAEGQLSPQRFEAARTESVIDEDETERLEQEARDAVPEPREANAEVESSVIAGVRAVFDDVAALAVGDAPAGPAPIIPTLPTTSTTSTTESTEAPAEPDPAQITGVVYIDADGDQTFNPVSSNGRVDRGVAGVTFDVTTNEEEVTVITDAAGVWTFQYAGGPVVIEIDTDDPDIPSGYLVSTDNHGQLIECAPGETCEASSIGLGVNLRPITEIVDSIDTVAEETVQYLAAVASDDVIRNALGEPLHLSTIQQAAIDRVIIEFARNIQPGDQLQSAKANIRSNPPFVFHADTGPDEQGGGVAGEVVATNLQANYLINEEKWQEEQDAAAAEILPVEVEFTAGQMIVDQGVPLTNLHIAAIEATSVPTIIEQPSAGLMAVIIVLVALLGLYLGNFRPEFWSRPRMMALLGIVIVLTSAAVRGTVALEEISWYVFPAVAFGFVTAVLFDQRIAVLMALAVGVLTAVGTLDSGVTVYASLASLAPIPFVSAVSTRGSFRSAVVLSSLVAAAVAGSTSWFFHVGPNDMALEVVSTSTAWAFGVSVVASMVGLAALQFFESAFDITTTLGLLDLTDRNHKALQMLQEKAFGTFNHSLMVGTLADAAARAIGANALLARAMAYYHDLGKTENPTYFIENQFGMKNPHDDMDPRDSAQVIRNHVTSGVALALAYKIPTDVTEGIVSHHGDGVMRFFYEKARARDGDEVDIDDFRHIGHKPRTAETAILMLADALEAACRAEFQSAEPVPEAIEKVVDKVMDEKVEDGQLSESPLTLGELSKIRQAFLESLIGHYHQRIAYPNFPGS
jgi:putative nucleotidyltransferase with HDIG domain